MSPPIPKQPEVLPAGLQVELQSGLPADWQLRRVERRGDDLLLTLACADAEVALDARRSPNPRAPWQAGGWSLTYRGSAPAVATLGGAGRALVQLLACQWPAGLPAAAPSHAAVPRQPPLPKASGFWREDKWLQQLALTGPRGWQPAVQHALDAIAPAPSPVHLQLYLQGDCGQRCVFCTVPLQRDQRPQPAQDALRLVADGALLVLLHSLAARPGSVLTLLGDDWANHREQSAVLQQLREAPAVRVGLLGPGTALDDPALRAQVLALPNLAHLTVTLQGQPDAPEGAAVHDRVVGQVGAAARLATAITALLTAGCKPAVATVLVAPSLPGLGSLLLWCAERGLEVAASGFVPDRCDLPAWTPGAYLPSAAQLYAALDALPETAAAALVRISGVPRCAVPERLAAVWSGHWPSAEVEPWQYPADAPCHTCRARTVCKGVPQSMALRHGTLGLRALPSA